MNENYDEDEVLWQLEEKIQKSQNGEDAKGFAQAYSIVKRANNSEWEEIQRLETEIKKSKWTAFGVVAASAIGAIITGALKIFGDLSYQERCQKFEDMGAFCNYTKHKRR